MTSIINIPATYTIQQEFIYGYFAEYVVRHEGKFVVSSQEKHIAEELALQHFKLFGNLYEESV